MTTPRPSSETDAQIDLWITNYLVSEVGDPDARLEPFSQLRRLVERWGGERVTRTVKLIDAARQPLAEGSAEILGRANEEWRLDADSQPLLSALTLAGAAIRNRGEHPLPARSDTLRVGRSTDREQAQLDAQATITTLARLAVDLCRACPHLHPRERLPLFEALARCIAVLIDAESDTSATSRIIRP